MEFLYAIVTLNFTHPSVSKDEMVSPSKVSQIKVKAKQQVPIHEDL